MQVGRTVEQLRRRRHAFLGPYIPPVHERQFQRVDPAEEVGQLKGIIGGEERSLIITLGEDFWIGRRPECDLKLDDPSISNFHLRIYAVRTSCRQSLICIHDLSTNGFLLNDIAYKPTQLLDIDGKACSTRSVIIRPGDTLRFPESSIELVCRYFSRHSEATQATQNAGQVRCHVPALFTSSDPSLTRTLDPWVIQNFTLGTGSFGRVHLATHREIAGLQVACKTVGITAQIETEVQVLKGLDHPNVCGIYDMFREEDADMIHLFLPLVSGGDLFSYLEKHSTLTEDEGKFAAFQLLQAIEFLHGKGIAHRDVKPENVLLHKSGAYPHLLLADFGLATTLSQISAIVPWDKAKMFDRHYRQYTGTSLYVPPERLRAILGRKRSMKGMAESTHGMSRWRAEVGRTWFDEEAQLDIWAVGLILYLILTGAHPYDDRADLDDLVVMASTSTRTQTTHTRRPSSAQSWDMFRAGNPSGSIGEGAQSEQEREWRRVESRCTAFTKLGRNQWEPAEKWTTISTEGRNFVAGILNPHPDRRFAISQALDDPWLNSNQAELDKVYNNVVTQGKLERASVWNRNGGVPPTNKRELEAAKALAAVAKRAATRPDDDTAPSSTAPPLKSSAPSTATQKKSAPTSSAPARPDPPAKKRKETKRKHIGDPNAPKQPLKKPKGPTDPTSDFSTPTPAQPTPPAPKVPKPRMYKPEPKKKNTAPRRPTSLFLPTEGIFGDDADLLDDIPEMDENDAAAEESAGRATESLHMAGMTLNDALMASAGGSGSGSGSGGSGESQTMRNMGGEEESFPPVKAGQRKSFAPKKTGLGIGGISKFAPASKLAALADAASVHPSDLAVSLSQSSSSALPDIINRKSTFQPPAAIATGKTGAKRSGVVLKRVEKA